MSRHLKRLAAPRVLSISRKTHTWIVRPSPGPHPIDRCIPLLLIVRDYLKYCDTGSEGRRIIGNHEIYVDGRVVTNPKYPVGLMDVLSVPKLEEHYRVLIDTHAKLRLVSIDGESAKWKLVRIENKTMVKGGKVQLNLHDGRNILLDKNQYKTGDVLKIAVRDRSKDKEDSQKILDVYPFREGNVALLIGGRHVGQIATIKNYQIRRSVEENLVSFEEGFITTKSNVFVVGYRSPEIKLVEESIV